jgi:hypothetical protein
MQNLPEVCAQSSMRQTTRRKIGRLEDWKIGRLEDWKIGRLEDWKIGRLEDWKIGRFCSAGSLSHDAAGAFSFLNVDIFNIYIQEKKSHRILMHLVQDFPKGGSVTFLLMQ